MPDIDIEMGSQVSQKFSFQTVLRKMKWKQIPKKIENATWGPFGQIEGNVKFLQILNCHVLGVKIM